MAQNNVQAQNNDQYHSFVDYPEALHDLLPGIIAPQKVYTPPPSQNQADAVPHDPIRFFTNGRPGLRINDAMLGLLNGLDGADTQPLLSQTNNRVALRILWPGYGPWTLTNALDTGGQRNPRTLSQIANQVANRIREFYNELATVAGTEQDWNLAGIPFVNLYLVELRNVSAGSWQPVICRSV